MLQGWVVIAVALAYIGLLFLIASYGDRARRHGRSGAHADSDLPAVAGDLLHLLDLLRLGRLRLADGLRVSHHLHRSGADGRAVLAADHPHRAPRQGAEHHVDRRLHRRALRQGATGRGAGGADRHHRDDSLHRAAAQGGVVLARDHPRPRRPRQQSDQSRARRHRACSWRSRWRPSPCCSAPATSTPRSIRTA